MAAVSQPEAGATLTVEQGAVYDRQIRLWGVAAQQKFVLKSLRCLAGALLTA